MTGHPLENCMHEIILNRKTMEPFLIREIDDNDEKPDFEVEK